MIIDVTAEFVPVMWSIVAVLVILSLAILSKLDPEIYEVYFGGPSLVITVTGVAAIVVAVLITVSNQEAAASVRQLLQ